jgi:hypothetical protein
MGTRRTIERYRRLIRQLGGDEYARNAAAELIADPKAKMEAASEALTAIYGGEGFAMKFPIARRPRLSYVAAMLGALSIWDWVIVVYPSLALAASLTSPI